MPDKDTSLMVAEEMFGAGMGRVWTSIPNDGSRKSIAAISNAMDDAESLRDHLGEVLEIENILLHDVTIEREDGEDFPAVRAVLIGSDGTCYASVSSGVISSLQKILTLAGMAPWTPPLRLVAREVNTRKGRRTIRLRMLE